MVCTYGLSFAGFQGTLAIQSALANITIIRFYSVVPMVMGILMFIILTRYDLDKRYPEIMAELERRKNTSQ